MTGIDPQVLEARYRLLLQISQQISRTLDLPELLQQLLDAVQTAVPYDAAGIFVLSRSVPLSRGTDGNVIAGMAARGFPQRQTRDDPMLRSGKGIIGHVIRTGTAVIAPDVRLDEHYVQGRAQTLSEVAVPIVSSGEVIGALNLESDRLAAYKLADAELLEFFALAAASAIEKALLHRHVLERQRIENQLRLARDVQTSLLPGASPELAGYDLAGVNLPTWEIGGDYFDYLPLDGGSLGVVVADVSGKGISAALLMATFRAALRAALHSATGIEHIVEQVDRILRDSMDASRFVTAVYGVLHPPSGRFSYVNCGHNPPMLLRADGVRETLESGGPAFGMIGDRKAVPASVTLNPGDALVLFTDGVVELTDAAKREYGISRLERAVRDHMSRAAAEMIDRIVHVTREYSGHEGYEDDFTLVILKRDAPSAAPRVPSPVLL